MGRCAALIGEPVPSQSAVFTDMGAEHMCLMTSPALPPPNHRCCRGFETCTIVLE